MHITRYTDYSLRVLMYLGLKNGELSTIKEIAESYNISKNHLMKVVQELSNKGYLLATRGKNGGILLNTPPASINIGALIRETEEHFALVECFAGGNGCVVTPACQLKKVFAEALEAFFKTLDAYTLADLLPHAQKAELAQLLRIETIDIVDASKPRRKTLHS